MRWVTQGLFLSCCSSFVVFTFYPTSPFFQARATPIPLPPLTVPPSSSVSLPRPHLLPSIFADLIGGGILDSREARGLDGVAVKVADVASSGGSAEEEEGLRGGREGGRGEREGTET